MKLNEEKIKKINGLSTFDYIRILFSLEDEKFEELINDCDFKIKPLFSMNLIYPFGQLNEVGGKELLKTCVFFSEIEMTYSFICENCESNKFTNLLDDIRISLQNFLILLNFKSYYSAFSELRKVLEGVLWIQSINEDPNNLNEEQINNFDDKTYGKLFKQYSPELIPLWKILNKLTHIQKVPISFNINKYYNTIDYLYNLVIVLQKVWSIIYVKLNIVLIIFEKHNYKLITRYRKMLNKLHLENEELEIKNEIPSSANYVEYNKSDQKLLLKIFENNNINLEYEKGHLLQRYWNRLVNIEEYIFTINRKDYELEIKSTQYVTSCIKYMRTKISGYKWFSSLIFYDYFYSINLYNTHHSLRLNTNDSERELLNYLKSICLELFSRELIYNGNKNIAILRTLIEEFIFNFIVQKIECYNFLNYIYEFLNEFFSYKIKTWKKFNKYKHILYKERILYYSKIKDSTTGEATNTNEILLMFLKAFEDVLELIDANIQ